MQNYRLLSHILHVNDTSMHEARHRLPSWSPNWSMPGLPSGQVSLRDAFMRKIDDPGNLESGWAAQQLDSTISWFPITRPSLNINPRSPFQSRQGVVPEWATGRQSRLMPFQTPSLSFGNSRLSLYQPFEAFEDCESFGEQIETLPPALFSLYGQYI